MSLACLVFLQLSVGHTAIQESSKRMQAISQGLQEVHLKCPERIWPNYSWKKGSVVFYDLGADKLWGMDPYSLNPVSLPSDAIPGYFKQAPYTIHYDQIKKQMQLIIGLNQAEAVNERNLRNGKRLGDRALSLVFHEGFHAFEQMNLQVLLKDLSIIL